MNQIDLTILIIIALFIMVGYRKGLVRSILSLVQYIVVVFFSFQLTKPVADFLINKVNLDETIITWFYGQAEAVENKLYMISEEMVQMFVGRIVNVVAFLLVFILLKILFRIVITILTQIFQLPILNEINKLGGIVLGGIEGILIVYILITLINWLPLELLKPTQIDLDNSLIGKKISYYVPAVATEIIENVNIKDVASLGKS